MPSIGPMEIILVLVIALLVVGPRKLPEMGRTIGRSVRQFREAARNVTKELGVEDLAEDVQELRGLTRKRGHLDLKKELGLDELEKDDDNLGAFPDLTSAPDEPSKPPAAPRPRSRVETQAIDTAEGTAVEAASGPEQSAVNDDGSATSNASEAE